MSLLKNAKKYFSVFRGLATESLSVISVVRKFSRCVGAEKRQKFVFKRCLT